MVKERNVVLCIIFSIITCGIYGIYWFITLTDDSNRITNSPCATGGVAFLLTLVTCGIYGWYWSYKMGEKVDQMKVQRGEAGSSLAILFIILSVLGLGIVNYVIAQLEINKYSNVAAQ